MTRAVAINVAANTNEPGVRGPLYADGSFEYVPIPESEPTSEPLPTYADLDLAVDLPDGAADRPVHLDPTFAEYPCCDRYTYGDPHGVKARPLLDLSAGDRVYFYATLDAPDAPADWMADDWGAYLIGEFVLACDPVDGDEYAALPAGERERFAGNAHLKRDPFDAAVLLAGTDASRLYDTAVPLSEGRGIDANRAVTEWSADSGKGPWWRRPLRYDDDSAARLREWVQRESYPPVR
ncbi:Nmad3 family putative nucleotide modification protein [Halobacterium litoreum]|uniref:Nucleotide modification associated domain-containing protein n=1 Tax=Halobacterium litoreum TaxID=2039234 RepID=A0ABD5NE11_9EURY|nr:hypothetical protein [Halobacterium litoreum]UHH13649.1 hypothetical protein LT972_01320 [Halobacterium litoreum]